MGIFRALLEEYGPQHWWPGDGAFETIVGAILTQNVAWPNAERALTNLRTARVMSPVAILQTEERELAQLVRPAGCFNLKARRLRAFCQMLQLSFHGSLESLLATPMDRLRELLLSTYGVGPETADDIVLYAAGYPSFVVDAYTRRVFSRLAIGPDGSSYDAWRSFFMSSLPPDPALFNEYHALIDHHAKVTCATRPACASCVLLNICPSAVAFVNGTMAATAAR